MVSDETFRDAVIADPASAVAESGYNLTRKEIDALGRLEPGDLEITTVRRGGVGPVASFELDVRTARF
jgi:hypothetical protein